MPKRSVILAIATLLLLQAGAALAQGKPMARLAAYRGDVSIVRRGIPLSIYRDIKLQSGDRVITQKGVAKLIFHDGGELRMRPNSNVVVSESATDGRDFRVFAGRLWARVKSWRETGIRSKFRSGGTITAVRGTVIEYAVAPPPSKDIWIGLVSGGPLEIIVLDRFGVEQRVLLEEPGVMVRVIGGAELQPEEPFSEGEIADMIDPANGFIGATTDDVWKGGEGDPDRLLLLPCGECAVPTGFGDCEDVDSLCPDTVCLTNRLCRSGQCIGGRRTSSLEDPNCP